MEEFVLLNQSDLPEMEELYKSAFYGELWW